MGISSAKRNIWGIFLVESSWAAQELSLVMAVETFTCINNMLPLRALPGAAGRTSWWLRRERGVALNHMAQARFKNKPVLTDQINTT